MNNLDSALERLYALRTFGIKPGLDVEIALLERLGNPQASFAAIHVAGTNGKGSVCAMLDAVLRTTGLTVGLYTSPHLVRFNERIRVNGVPISDVELAELFEAMEGHAEAVKRGAEGREVTFFEFTTALAFEYFRRRQVQVAVVEVGMGGRLDATNVVWPVISVITRIGLEHTAYLGTTLAAIAGEKAGIIKPGRPVVCGATPDEAREVIRSTAQERNAPYVEAAETVTARRVSQDLTGQKVAITSGDTGYGTVRLSLLGKHQLENVVSVVAALETLGGCSPLRVPPDLIRRGLGEARWPGRLQVLSETPPVVLDGAHNPDGARVLALALKDLFKKRKVGLIWGMCEDKDALGFAKALGGAVHRCWTVPIATERSLDPARLALLASGEGWETKVSGLVAAREEARQWALDNQGVVCIAGSLFLAGEVLGAGVD
ncbi:MAG: folylpolyglutamate synthase/dihydrofolate synthase family protein [bacterium]